jgi:hypothetical protein
MRVATSSVLPRPNPKGMAFRQPKGSHPVVSRRSAAESVEYSFRRDGGPSKA